MGISRPETKTVAFSALDTFASACLLSHAFTLSINGREEENIFTSAQVSRLAS